MRFWSKVLNVFAPSHARPERRHEAHERRKYAPEVDWNPSGSKAYWLKYRGCPIEAPFGKPLEGVCGYCGEEHRTNSPQVSTEPCSALSDEQEFTK